MQAAKGALAFAALAMLGLAACSGGSDEPRLMNLRSATNGPDEFAIIPPKPLEMPKDLAALPAPTPGGTNLTDPTPEADAIIALGGRPGAQRGVPAGDAGLVNHASRNGVSGTIREDLAVADLDHRRRNDGRLLERLFGSNVYYRAYREQELDQHAELARWRRAGAQNVSAPPRQSGE
ncbi:DUF3035 domain-containing protein [Szabonella alba]|uniref:DUF3035 domain-containing protein n=1 Tax=Szabonella alba TaxID=2804194 RepID=A0A8K0VCV2_9RHOB|nr:DUF3035 domain-containing protein [Szabonella alba]MBL4916962.1 DUF3035 domain-containing protein [Szabonella alba]